MEEKSFNRLFNLFIFFGMLVSVIVASIINIRSGQAEPTQQLVVAVGAMFGVASTMLAAQGNILNFIFGLLGAVIETYLLWKSGITSMFLLYLFYFIPMDFVGFFQWWRRGARAKKEVRAQRLEGRKWLWVVLGYVAIAAAAFGISWFAGSRDLGSAVPAKMVMDALTTAAYVLAIVMMTFAYVEQWYVWTLVNLSSIVLWTVNLVTTPDSAYTVVMVIKYFFYLLNGLNAIRIWLKLSRAGAGLEK